MTRDEVRRFLKEFDAELVKRDSVVVTSGCMLHKAVENALEFLADDDEMNEKRIRYNHLMLWIKTARDVWSDSRERSMQRYEEHISDAPLIAAFERGMACGLTTALCDSERWADDDCY